MKKAATAVQAEYEEFQEALLRDLEDLRDSAEYAMQNADDGDWNGAAEYLMGPPSTQDLISRCMEADVMKDELEGEEDDD